MTPVVAVIAPGMMGAAVGKRLVDNGVKVLTSLKGRSAETATRAKAAGMAAASDEEIAARRFHSVDPAAGRRAGACASAFEPALKASNAKPVYVDCNAINPRDGRAGRRGHCADRLSVRRFRHHRLAAEAAAMPGRGFTPPARRRRALPRLRQYGLDIRVLDGATERGFRAENVLCRHHQGHAGDRCRDDAGRDARRLRRRAVRGAAARARRRCSPGSSAAWR